MALLHGLLHIKQNQHMREPKKQHAVSGSSFLFGSEYLCTEADPLVQHEEVQIAKKEKRTLAMHFIIQGCSTLNILNCFFSIIGLLDTAFPGTSLGARIQDVFSIGLTLCIVIAQFVDLTKLNPGMILASIHIASMINLLTLFCAYVYLAGTVAGYVLVLGCMFTFTACVSFQLPLLYFFAAILPVNQSVSIGMGIGFSPCWILIAATTAGLVGVEPQKMAIVVISAGLTVLAAAAASLALLLKMPVTTIALKSLSRKTILRDPFEVTQPDQKRSRIWRVFIQMSPYHILVFLAIAVTFVLYPYYATVMIKTSWVYYTLTVNGCFMSGEMVGRLISYVWCPNWVIQAPIVAFRYLFIVIVKYIAEAEAGTMLQSLFLAFFVIFLFGVMHGFNHSCLYVLYSKDVKGNRDQGIAANMISLFNTFGITCGGMVLLKALVISGYLPTPER